MDNDFDEFVQHIEDNLVYLPVPRVYIRDMENPLERYSNNELLQRYRFSRRTIYFILLPLIYSNHPETQRGLPIPPVVKLCIALRYFATGCFQRVCGDLQYISQPTACRIVREVSDILARNLARYVKFPPDVQVTAVKQAFFRIAHFPGVVGCIDGTHIEIKSPGGPNAEVFRNRKSWMSLNVQAIVGASAEILDIVIRWPGSAHDSRIFNNSSVKVRFEQNQLSGLLLGDSAYPQSKFLYTPVPNPTTVPEQRYNRAHILTRNVIERAFGQWKQRFQCLLQKLLYNLNTSRKIIAATAVLHNIAINEKERLINDDSDFVDRTVPMLQAINEGRASLIRGAFIERHFTN